MIDWVLSCPEDWWVVVASSSAGSLFLLTLVVVRIRELKRGGSPLESGAVRIGGRNLVRALGIPIIGSDLDSKYLG